MFIRWYVFKGGVKTGPFGITDLRQLVASGQLTPTDELWREGTFGRIPAGSVKGLFTATTTAAPKKSSSQVTATPMTPKSALPQPQRLPIQGPPRSSGTVAQVARAPAPQKQNTRVTKKARVEDKTTTAEQTPRRLGRVFVAGGIITALVLTILIASRWFYAPSPVGRPIDELSTTAPDRLDPPDKSVAGPAGAGKPETPARGAVAPPASATGLPPEITGQRPWPVFPLEKLQAQLLRGPEGQNVHAFFSPGGRFVMTLSSESETAEVRLWRTDTAEEVVARGSEANYFSLPAAFSPDEAQLACLDGEFVRIWDLSRAPATLIQSLVVPGPSPRHGGPDLWNRLDWYTPEALLLAHHTDSSMDNAGQAIRRVAGSFAPAGPVHRAPQQYQGESVWFSTAVMSPDGKHIVSAVEPSLGSSDSEKRLVIRIQATESLAEVGTIELAGYRAAREDFPRPSFGAQLKTNHATFENPGTCLEFVPNSSSMLVATQRGELGRVLVVIDANAWRKVAEIPIHEASDEDGAPQYQFQVRCYSQDGSRLAGIGIRRSRTSRGEKLARAAVVYELASGKRTAEIPLGDNFSQRPGDGFHRLDREAVTFGPNGRDLVVAVISESTWNHAKDRAECGWAVGSWALPDGRAVSTVTRLQPAMFGQGVRLGQQGRVLVTQGAGMQAWDIPHIVHICRTLASADQAWTTGDHATAFDAYCSILADSTNWFIADDLPRVWSRCVDALSERGKTVEGRRLILHAQDIGIRIAPETTAGRKLCDDLFAEQALARERADRERGEAEAQRVADVRAKNQARRITPAAMTRAEFVDALRAVMRTGRIDGLVTYALFEDHAFEDVFGSPDTDIEWINTQRLLGFRCRDGVVVLRATLVGPKVIVQGIDLL